VTEQILIPQSEPHLARNIAKMRAILSGFMIYDLLKPTHAKGEKKNGRRRESNVYFVSSSYKSILFSTSVTTTLIHPSLYRLPYCLVDRHHCSHPSTQFASLYSPVSITKMADNDAASVTSSTAPSLANKRAEQMKKLKDANTKYKDLLKMAKERIQSQEEDLEKTKCKFVDGLSVSCIT